VGDNFEEWTLNEWAQTDLRGRAPRRRRDETGASPAIQPFAAEREDDGRTIAIRLTGELDMAAAPAVEEQLLRAAGEGRPILLDLRGLQFLDTNGLRAIVAGDWRIRLAHGRLVVLRGPRPVQRVFEITGLDQVLELADDPAAAS
jgi:anti-sigma B factor antagonist